MGLFNRRVPDEALFGATAMVFALCIETIFNGGETSTEERMCQMSSLRKALGDLDGSYPGCLQAIAMLDAHHPVDPIGLMAFIGEPSAPIDLTRDQVAQVETLTKVALDGLSSGADDARTLAVGEAMVDLACGYLPDRDSADQSKNCALIIGLAIAKVNSDTAGVKPDERLQRRKYAAAIAGHWLYRQVCA